jgi:hypothetical protein
MKAILVKGYPKYQKDIKDSQTKELFRKQIDGFKYTDEAMLVELGFKDVVDPTKTVEQKFGEWHETPTQIKRYVIDLVIDLPLEKANKIKELKQLANHKFEATQWYYDRESRFEKNGKTMKPVPQSIIDADSLIYELVDLKEKEILALTTYTEILAYDVNL